MAHKAIDTNILFFDIETVPQKETFDQPNPSEKNLWLKKAKTINRMEVPDRGFYKRARIYAESGKIVCISIARVVREYGSAYIAVESFSSHNERRLLKDFCVFLKETAHSNIRLCAHNSKEFDFPYIARWCLIRGLRLPEILNIQGKSLGRFKTSIPWRCGSSVIGKHIPD